ncbi:UNVERIFIED_CONTAM: hypothetical protein GTU68_062880 [Idotea baltica]|nr:hypothetical protein [Idotea baltica]
MLILGGISLAAAASLAAWALTDSIVFFFGPTELMAKEASGEVTPQRRLRVGGMIVEGTLRDEDGVVKFRVTDFENEIPVSFKGIRPDLIIEGQGAVAEGYFQDGQFRAVHLLAKHDEKYIPREVQDILKDDKVLKAA